MHPPASAPLPTHIALDSSSLQSVAYVPEAATLEIAFRNGSIYRYFGVPFSIYQALLEAGSKGRCFIATIRTSFRFERVQ
jgi:hypothetical protein